MVYEVFDDGVGFAGAGGGVVFGGGCGVGVGGRGIVYLLVRVRGRA